jgi:hypothetical protein
MADVIQNQDPFTAGSDAVGAYASNLQTLKDAAQKRQDDLDDKKQAQSNWQSEQDLRVKADTRADKVLADSEVQQKFDNNLATVKATQEALVAKDAHRAAVLQHYIDNITAQYASKTAAINFANLQLDEKKKQIDNATAGFAEKLAQLNLQYAPAREARQVTADTDTHNESVARTTQIGVETGNERLGLGKGGRGGGADLKAQGKVKPALLGKEKLLNKAVAYYKSLLIPNPTGGVDQGDPSFAPYQDAYSAMSKFYQDPNTYVSGTMTGAGAGGGGSSSAGKDLGAAHPGSHEGQTGQFNGVPAIVKKVNNTLRMIGT